MAMSGGSDDGAPMMEMNTTPLIDVMLCMLIIFILFLNFVLDINIIVTIALFFHIVFFSFHFNRF